MKQIAIYGKGGIGKSTITANLSASLSKLGKKVLQIGCDPKHDSTKLLLGGISQNTVLELLKTKSSYELSEEEVVIKGYNGIDCIEAGGPEPGVGCAGRGILAMAKALEDIGLNLNKYDVVIYDVLGDVVCGGFAVPMRNEYADEVYIVTSGEIMALYAANNIAKGLMRFGGKLSGIILNERNVQHEKELANNFAQKIGAEILANFPRDNRFRESEVHRMPLIERFADSDIALEFEKLAKRVISENSIIPPKPLNDSEFEQLICSITGQSELNKHIKPATAEIINIKEQNNPDFSEYLDKTPVATQTEQIKERTQYLSGSVKNRGKLHCCSLAGAYAVTANIKNTITIMHAPANCANIAISTNYFSAMDAMLRDVEPSSGHAIPQLLCTNLNESDLVYGAEEKLEKEVLRVIKEYSPEAVFIITSCPTGIIGDDPEKVAKKFENSAVPVIPIETDGVLKGDYSQGVINTYKQLAETVIEKDCIEKDRKLINLVGEEIIGNRAEDSYYELKSILEEMGLAINCRFVRNTSFESIAGFNRAAVSCIMSTNSLAKTAEQILKEFTGAQFLDVPPPVGFAASMEFITKLAEKTGAKLPEKYIETMKKERQAILDEIIPVLSGKKALLNVYTMNIAWLIDLADEINLEILGAAVYKSGSAKEYDNHGMNIFEIDGLPGLMQLIDDLKPDLLLSSYLPKDLSDKVRTGTIPSVFPPGFNSILSYAKSWTKPFKSTPGLWRNDRNPEIVL